MKKFDAYVVGTISASACSALAFGIGWRDVTVGFFGGLGYAASCCIQGPFLAARAKARGDFDTITSREWFWWPFALISMAPLFLACFAVVYDWQITHPLRRQIGIGALFAAAVPSFLLLFWLMDPRLGHKTSDATRAK
jgi:uncharacterized BrkB/YihY/UPF0761 family membrane protein